MVKVSVNRFISRRIKTVRNEIEAETQRLPKNTVNKLEEIFKVAAKVAMGGIRHQRINGKMAPISLNQRRRWARVAEQVAKTMNNIASNLDEKEIHGQLDELEKLVNEVKALDQSWTKE